MKQRRRRTFLLTRLPFSQECSRGRQRASLQKLLNNPAYLPQTKQTKTLQLFSSQLCKMFALFIYKFLAGINYSTQIIL